MLPWLLVRDLWRAPEPDDGVPPPPVPGAIVLWWALLVADGLIGYFSHRGTVGPQTVLFFAAAPFAVRTVTVLTARVRKLENTRVLTPAAAWSR